MSKKIKAIKCPQCGSTSSTQIKDDHYKCDNCNAQFYLDSDDININVTHKIETPRVDDRKNNKKALSLFLFWAVAMLILVVLTNIGSDDKELGVPYGSIMIDTPIESNGKMYLLTLSNSFKNDEESFYSFTDFDTKEVVSSKKLVGVKKLSNSISECSFRKFSNGDIYFIIDNQKLFKLDNDKMELNDIIPDLVREDSIYRAGVANIEPFASNYGDCFQIMTNLGKEYYYYPCIKQSYPYKNLYEYSKDTEFLRPDSKEAITYKFTKKGWSGMDIDKIDEVQLLKIIYQDNGGGPSNSNFDPEWSKLDDSLIIKFSSPDRMVSYKNLTPDRLYFNPNIFYADADYLLMKVTATASEKSAPSLQRINTTTGELMWSIPLNLENDRYVYYYDRALHANNKFALKLNDPDGEYLLISDDGKDVQYFTLRD